MRTFVCICFLLRMCCGISRCMRKCGAGPPCTATCANQLRGCRGVSRCRKLIENGGEHTLPIPSGPGMMLNCSCRTSTPGSNIWHQPCLAEQTNFTAVGKIDSGCGHTQHRFYPAVLCPPFAPFEAQFQPTIPPSPPAPHVHFSGHFSTD